MECRVDLSLKGDVAMQSKFFGKLVVGGVLALFLVASFCMASWDTPGKDKIVKIEPSSFRAVFNDFLKEFQNGFPEKPTPTPEKGEFETSPEFDARRTEWENNYEKAVADYRASFLKTVPVFELYDLQFEFGRYNADKGCFSEIKSSRFKVAYLNPVCDGHEIDAACNFGPLERYAHVTIKNVCINREKAKTLKADTAKLRLRVGFTLVPPYPKEKREKLKYYFHHVSIYDKETEDTLFVITDKRVAGIKHGK